MIGPAPVESEMPTDKDFQLLRPYLSALVIFSILRAAFLLYHLTLFRHSPTYDIAQAFLNGMMIDSSVAATTLFLIRIISLSVQIISRNAARITHQALLYFSFGLYFFINIGDIIYFGMFDSRFNILLLDNLDQMGPIIGTVFKDFPILTVTAASLLAIACLVWLKRLLNRFGNFHLIHQYKKSALTISMVMLVGLSFLWVGEPFWRMTAFLTGDQALNQLSLNGVYTLAKAVDQKRILKRDKGDASYKFGPDEIAINSFRDRIISPNEEYLSQRYPLARKIIEPKQLSVEKPNIVIVLMEGFSASFIGSLRSDGTGHSPGFDSLAEMGILFTNLYGHETRTHHGLVSTVGSFPSILGLFITRRRGTESFYTLGTLLKNYGYGTSFIYGYDQGYDHMGFFLKQGGFDQIIDREDFPNPRFEAKWGVSDEDLFDKSIKFFSEMPEDSPFFSVLLTSSNHTPHEVPEHFLESHPEYADDKMRAAFAYSDYALKKFIEKSREESFFEKTIFIILADHGEIRDPDDRYFKRFHIPGLIYAPHFIDSPLVIETIGGQVDIATTILHLIGYPDPFHFVGRNLLEIPEEEGFAFMRNNFNIYYRTRDHLLVRDIRDTLATVYPVDGQSRMMQPTEKEDLILKSRMIKELEIYIQSINYIFTTGKHRIEEANRQ